MQILIIKLGATGDVVRTTPLLEVLQGEITWLTADNNRIMLDGHSRIRHIVDWHRAASIYGKSYDLVINLEDTEEACLILKEISYDDLFGAYLSNSGQLCYTDNSRSWFDLSLISRYGKEKADQLKLQNRRTYQEMIFKGLGYHFNDHPYYLPPGIKSDLAGDIAMAPKAGKVWPMKNWAFFAPLKERLESDGFKVNYLPHRKTLLEHIGDIQNHRFLICGDSLPMHIAIGSRIKCISTFICTSPWEIHDYGYLEKIVAPELGKHFYQRYESDEATSSISLEEVYRKTITKIGM